MKINCLCVNRSESHHLDALIEDYIERIKKQVDFSLESIDTPKNFSKLNPNERKKAEGELILKRLGKSDYIILLDEKGKSFTSLEFANQLQRHFNAGHKNIYFVVGGAYGFSDAVYKRAQEMLSLSKMTTTHQLVRLIFAEQIYRALSILSGHPYHNE
ncbi:MAG: 23S rRNA (pseudouridine(1915)-N(3))-methyltransferase RlmH [Bacteroidota bacterium]|nr:MAG: 23S rRNA (pseudouridine(1915)-N(3))-methyltransferase RlmH [Bacteroidota bacterium]